jgi:MFS family permease
VRHGLAADEKAGVVSTVLGEITDKSNQISAFAWLPIIYGIGAITGPIIGGVLADISPPKTGPVSRLFANYPYLLPNLVCSLILLVDLGLSFFMLEESLEEAQKLPPLGHRVKCLFTWLWQFTASYRPSFLRFGGCSDNPEEDVSVGTLAEACPALLPERPEEVAYQSILVPQIGE